MKLENGGLNNIYRAVVESNIDPLEIGRIQVRVPFLHGNPNSYPSISTENLPYAKPCMSFASRDAGTLLIPEVGSMVFLLFENGDHDKPVYIGQMYSKGKTTYDMIGYPGSNMYKETNGERARVAFADDTIKGSYKNGIFQKFTIFKSPKGSTVEINDNDEEERLSVIDRMGQIFTMSAPATEEYSHEGYNNRGVFTVLKSKFKGLISRPAIILIKTLNKSILRFVSSNAESKLDLINVFEDTNAGMSVNIGVDNRLLVFYKDSLFEINEDSIVVKTKSFNVTAEEINLKAENIHSSAMIKVGDYNPKDAQEFVNSNDEEEIKE